MTCRHSKDDLSCSKNETRRERLYALEAQAQNSPDATRFEIDAHLAQLGNSALTTMWGPTASTAYEGKKVLVYLGVGLKDVIKWRRLDPHFRAEVKQRATNEAPSPAARFPASTEGWADALAWAASKWRKEAQGGGSYVDIHEGGTR